jgi:Fic family protein
MLETTQRGNLEITSWLLWFVACVDRSVSNALQIFDNVFTAGAFWAEHRGADFSDRQRKVLTIVLHGYDGALNTRNWARLGNTSKESAKRDLQHLVEKGVLRQQGAGRSTHYVLARNGISS